MTHSACYASKQLWEKSAEDAGTCVTKDPNFIKGYYRFATALTELKKYDEAMATLQAALSKEPGLISHFRILKSLFA